MSHSISTAGRALAGALLGLATLACMLPQSVSSTPVWRWSNPLPHGNNVVDMAYNNGLVVQVAELGQLYTSSDFVNWTPRDTHTTNALQAVTFLRNRLLAGGENGTVIYSDDGVNFVTVNLNTSDWIVGMAASPNLAVAVGDNAAIYTSADGVKWNRQTPPPNVSSSWLLSAAYGAGTFVVAGEKGYIATSTNGSNWTHRPTPTVSPPFTNVINRVAWINPASGNDYITTNGFWAMADNGRVLHSTNNGVNWRLVTGLSSTNSFYAAAGNETTRVVAGDQDVRLGTRLLSQVIWLQQTGALPPSAPAWTYYSALYDTNSGSYWLAGSTGMLVQGSVTNGSYQWQPPYSSVRSWLWDVIVAGGTYLAVGDKASVLTSDNGVDWTSEQIIDTNSISSTNTVFFGIGGNTNLLLAVGSQGSLAISPNNYVPIITTNQDGTLSTNQVSTLGIVWNSMPPPTADDLHGVGVLNNAFFVVGGNGTILSSSDGTNWTIIPSPTTAYLSSIAAGSNGLVVVGDAGTILTSPDGAAWTAETSNTGYWLNRVRWLKDKYVAVGENGTILLSSDGVNWGSVTSGTTAWLNDVQMVGDNFYIVGTHGTVLSSANLTNWVYMGANTAKSLYGAATQNGQLVAVGIEGVIIRTQIIPNRSPVNFLNYNRSGSFNIFLVNGLPDQSFRLESSSDLIRWSTNGPVLDFLNGSGRLLFIQDTGTNAPNPGFYRTKLLP